MWCTNCGAYSTYEGIYNKNNCQFSVIIYPIQISFAS